MPDLHGSGEGQHRRGADGDGLDRLDGDQNPLLRDPVSRHPADQHGPDQAHAGSGRDQGQIGRSAAQRDHLPDHRDQPDARAQQRHQQRDRQDAVLRGGERPEGPRRGHRPIIPRGLTAALRQAQGSQPADIPAAVLTSSGRIQQAQRATSSGRSSPSTGVRVATPASVGKVRRRSCLDDQESTTRFSSCERGRKTGAVSAGPGASGTDPTDTVPAVITRMSELFVRTLREDPADAEVPSHRWLVRAGYIRRAAPGIYSWLPLGYRVLRNVEQHRPRGDGRDRRPGGALPGAAAAGAVRGERPLDRLRRRASSG